MRIRKRGISGIYAWKVLTLTLFVLIPLRAMAQPEVSILYHEPLVLQDARAGDSGSANGLQFDAFGRRFVLLVENSRPGLSGPDVELISARLEGAPGSWARLTVRGELVSGMIRDAQETYVIEPRRTLLGVLMLRDDAADSPNIIYRLADTLVAPGLLSCDTHGGLKQVDGKTALASLTAELDPASLQATDGDVATIGAIADSFLYSRLQEDTQATVEQMFETVAGIYSEQAGVAIDVVSVDVSTSVAQDPIGTKRHGSRILDELGLWRVANQPGYAITHLITNRGLLAGDEDEIDPNDPKNQIAGISYLGTPGRSGVCDARTGASISEWIGSGITALVIAHEIGHNFGAPHDGEFAEAGEPLNPCAVVPPDTFLMSPTLRGSRTDEFSHCSLEQMAQVIAAARCLRPAPQLAADANSSDGGGGGAVDPATGALLIGLATLLRRRKIAELPI